MPKRAQNEVRIGKLETSSIMKKFLSALMLCVPVLVMGQNNGTARTNDAYDAYKKKVEERYAAYVDKVKRRYDEYRRSVNDRYAEKLERQWKSVDPKPPTPKPKDDITPPVIVPENFVPPVNPVINPIPFDEIVEVPVPKPQPRPVLPIIPTKPIDIKPVSPPAPVVRPINTIPIEEIDQLAKKPIEFDQITIDKVNFPIHRLVDERVKDIYIQGLTPIIELPDIEIQQRPVTLFTFFGTKAVVRYPKDQTFRLEGTDEQNVAKGWRILSGDVYTDFVADCLQLRADLQLCDWAYLLMLNKIANEVLGEDTNESTLLTGYLFCQSGYRVRFGRANNNQLRLLYASQHFIYDKARYALGGISYYVFNEKESDKRMYIGDVTYEGEQSLSLYVPKPMMIDMQPSEERTIKSLRYPEVNIKLVSNKNLLSFYDTYPTSMLGESFMTRWAMYANTPMNPDVKAQIYPTLKKAIEGCTQQEAANKLLNMIQTGMKYEYDDDVWGGDRAFFAEESLFYPSCDCEDRSILLTRLVRDLLGLKCVLIYYPGHLACAIHFTEDVKGDYVNLNGERFIVADPTIIGIGSPVGTTMRGMDNAKATVILLE